MFWSICRAPRLHSFFFVTSLPRLAHKSETKSEIRNPSQSEPFSADKSIRPHAVPGQHGSSRRGAMMQFAEDIKAYSRYAAEFDAPIRCELLYGDAREAVSK